MSAPVNICGLRLDNLTWPECLVKIDELIAKRDPSFIITPNVDHAVMYQKDELLREIYKSSSLNLADGVPLLWAAKFLGTPLKEKISGSDLLPILCREAAVKGHRLFFLGGRPGSADTAAAKLTQKYPGLKIVGTNCPPYGFEKNDAENKKIITIIQQAKPDILFVGFGAPKQEKWIYRFYHQYQAPVSIGIGGSFEFAAGMVKRAPVWMQKVGLEWFWRIMMEPGRLWRRYLVDDMQFFPLVLKQKFQK